MNKRQKEVMQAQLDSEKAVLKKLEENYKDALGEINSKIEILLARQDADMQHVIYQVEYQRALKTQVQAILEQLQSNEFETLSEYLTQSYEDGYIGTMYDLQGQGIPLIMPLDQEQVAQAIQHETQLSESLYTALGHDTKDLSKKIAGEISRGISVGMMYKEIARNVAGYARIPKNNAMRIARTEAHRIQCKAALDAQFKAKEKGADVVKQWEATLDSKTRNSHRELDGQVRELDKPFEVNGHKAMCPGGFGRPEEDINCRCALLQRARWALGNSYTKWSEDAPIVIDDDGTTQFAIIEADNLKDFHKRYMKAVENIGKSSNIVLTDTDVKAVHDYMSAKSYVVNEKLRTGTKLTDSEKEFVDNLDAALDKMPTYEGNLQRSLLFYSDEDIEAFMKRHTVGNTVTYDEYISTTKGETYNPEGQVQIYIQDAKNGKDISALNDGESEILYKRNSAFTIVNVVEQDGTYFILAVEDNE